MKPDKNLTIDNTDKQILTMLMLNGETPYAEIARKIFVSTGTVHVRMKKMKDAGLVSGTHLAINPEALGFDITAFIGIFLEKSSMYHIIVQQLKSIPEVTECYYTTGNYSIFMKILCKDTSHLKNVLNDKIQGIEGINRTETFISLEESINRPMVLIDELSNK